MTNTAIANMSNKPPKTKTTQINNPQTIKNHEKANYQRASDYAGCSNEPSINIHSAGNAKNYFSSRLAASSRINQTGDAR
jgi:hypothetical protein